MEVTTYELQKEDFVASKKLGCGVEVYLLVGLIEHIIGFLSKINRNALQTLLGYELLDLHPIYLKAIKVIDGRIYALAVRTI